MYKLAILLILVATVCSGQVADPSHPMIQFPDGSFLGPDNPMPINAVIDVGSVTVDVPPTFVTGSGTPVPAVLDALGNVPVAIPGLVSAIEDTTAATEENLKAIQDIPLSPTTTVVTKYTLAAGVATEITDAFYGMPNVTRKYIEVKTQLASNEFWVNFGTAAIIGAARPCMGRVYVDSRVQSLSVISSTTVDIFVTQAAIAIQP